MVLTRNASAAAGQEPNIVVPVSANKPAETKPAKLTNKKPLKATTKKTTRKTTRKVKPTAKAGGNDTTTVTQPAVTEEVPTFQPINSLGEDVAQAQASAERAGSADSDVFSGHYTLASERLVTVPAGLPRQADGFPLPHSRGSVRFQPRKLTYAQAVSRSPSPIESSDVVYYDASPLANKSRIPRQPSSAVPIGGATVGLSNPAQGTGRDDAVSTSGEGVVTLPSTTAQPVMSPSTVHNMSSEHVPVNTVGPKGVHKGRTLKTNTKTSTGASEVVINKKKPATKKPVLSPLHNKTDSRIAKRNGPPPRMQAAPSSGSSSSQPSTALGTTNSMSTDSDSPSMPTPERIVTVPVQPTRPARILTGRMSTGGKPTRRQAVAIVTADYDMEDVQPELPASPIAPVPDVAHLFDDDVQLVSDTQRYALDSEADQVSGALNADCTTDRDGDFGADLANTGAHNESGEEGSMDVDDTHSVFVEHAENDRGHTQSSEHMSPPPSTQPGSKRSHNQIESDDEPPKKRRAGMNDDEAPAESSQGTTQSGSSVVLLSSPKQEYDQVMRAELQEEILKHTYKAVPRLRYTDLIDEDIFVPYMFSRVNDPQYPRVIISDLIKLVEFASHAGTNIYNPSRADPALFKTRTNPKAKAYTDICRVGSSTFGKNAKLPLACSIVWSHTSSINYPEEYNGKLAATLFGHGLSQELVRQMAFFAQVLNDDGLSPVAGPNGTLRFGTYSVDPSAKPTTSARSGRTARAIDKSAVMSSSATMQMNDTCNMLYQRRTLGANANIPVWDATGRFKKGSKNRIGSAHSFLAQSPHDPLYHDPIPDDSLCAVLYTTTRTVRRNDEAEEESRLLSFNISGVIILVMPNAAS
ncbi:hypothetical protein FA95DRAFT_1575320 [Auriscalpium vulgare]|uniref:Uncharacterized protein n=1 Tax=Auriscalpium vulgare TaxID=40419 RepID=A0ACB8RGQ7_9AGAM|nr:hypothetical protein FA95DRAFT_1575320 [Auriscalpium vulgare]